MTFFQLANVAANSAYAIVDGITVTKGGDAVDLTDEQIFRLHRAGCIGLADGAPVTPAGTAVPVFAILDVDSGDISDLVTG